MSNRLPTFNCDRPSWNGQNYTDAFSLTVPTCFTFSNYTSPNIASCCGNGKEVTKDCVTYCAQDDDEDDWLECLKFGPRGDDDRPNDSGENITRDMVHCVDPEDETGNFTDGEDDDMDDDRDDDRDNGGNGGSGGSGGDKSAGERRAGVKGLGGLVLVTMLLGVGLWC